MGVCATCGNDYRRSFKVVMDEEESEFDSFECAIQALAPRCEHCETRIIGHGMESDGKFYCCAQCARTEGVVGLKDQLA